MREIEINDRDRQMLELLAKGASNRSIAESLGYREGTMRVYLHSLYRKIGVGNKTSAVIWYFDRLKSDDKHGAATHAPLGGAKLEESFGDMALRTNPFTALGAMSMFLGAYGRTWEVANRLKGRPVDETADRRRRQSRLLWESMLKGKFAYGKRLFDDDMTARLLVDSPTDCVLLACMLRIGGYTKAADRVMAQLIKRKKGSVGISAKEHAFLVAVREAMEGSATKGLAALYRIATESSAKPIPRHAAMVALFWAHKSHCNPDAARGCADALWAEAEAVRQQLHAMGERPLDPRAAVPPPGTAKTGSARKPAGKAAKGRAATVH